MKVILKERVDKLGEMGEIVRVRDGYARNYLLPKGLAAAATEGNLRTYEHLTRRAEEARRAAEAGAAELKAALDGVEIEIPALVSKEGTLYGSIGVSEIAESLAGKGFEIEKRKIEIPRPIKELGRTEVRIHLAGEIDAHIGVTVTTAEKDDLAKEE